MKSDEVEPLLNPKHEPSMRWDAYVSVNDPDALAAQFVGRGVVFSMPLRDTHDGCMASRLLIRTGMSYFSVDRGRNGRFKLTRNTS